MNPLSPLTYYRRHKRSAMLQIALISLATAGLFVLVAVLDTIPLRANVSYLTKLSRVIPFSAMLDPDVVSQIQKHPDVALTIVDNGLRIGLPSLIGTDSMQLLGVSQKDAQFLMQHCGVRLKEGRLFEPHTNEFVLSEEVARALGLELGSEIGRAIDQGYYEAVSSPLVLVGILEGVPSASILGTFGERIEGGPDTNSGPSVRLGFASADYLNNHDLYAPRATSLLIIAMDGRKNVVDDFLANSIGSKNTEVETYALLVEFIMTVRIAMYVIFGVVNSVVAFAMALVAGIINRIAITKRLSEFGLLNALGYHKKQLVRRLTLETATVAVFGCLIGLGMALAALSLLKISLFYNLGMELDLFNPGPFFFVLPIPVIVVALTFLSVRRIFTRLDSVAIVERGKLSDEAEGCRATKRSSARPLSFLTFNMRHPRRAVLMIFSTALMVICVVFPVFLLSAMTDSTKVYFEYLQHVSVVSPVHSEINPSLVDQIRGHQAVAHTVPALPRGMQVTVPPGGQTDVRIYGISEVDLPVILESFGMQVQEGSLPRPHSNEIVLSAAIAANRNLHVGDMIGGDIGNDNAGVIDDMPTEMVVAGILSPGHPLIGFASYEYLSTDELSSSRNPHLLVIPHKGQKQALDNWLETNIESTQTRIITYTQEEREHREMTTSIVLTFAALECMIAAVAAIALATLNYISYTQRREEYGILNAIGHGSRQLIWRTMKETISVIGVAWIVGAILCGVGLFLMQSLVYAPRGLTLNFFNPSPWLFTLPIPLAVTAVSASVIARMLSKFDPVSIIERR